MSTIREKRHRSKDAKSVTNRLPIRYPIDIWLVSDWYLIFPIGYQSGVADFQHNPSAIGHQSGINQVLIPISYQSIIWRLVTDWQPIGNLIGIRLVTDLLKSGALIDTRLEKSDANQISDWYQIDVRLVTDWYQISNWLVYNI